MKKLLITGLLALGMAGSALAVGIAPAEAAGVHVTINPGYGYHPVVRHHRHHMHPVTICHKVWRHHHRVRVCRTVWR